MLFYRTLGDIRINIDDYWTQATYSQADTYFTARGAALWTGTNDEKTQALQRAWDYFRTLNWIDDVFALEQPDDITNAHILLGLEELKTAGVLTPALTRDDYLISKSFGRGALSKEYRPGAPVFKRFKGVDMLLAPYITSSMNIRVERG